MESICAKKFGDGLSGMERRAPKVPPDRHRRLAAGRPASFGACFGTRRGLVRSARALAAAALLALSGALAPPAQAQTQTCTPDTAAGDLWCGVVTVAAFTAFGTDYVGYFDGMGGDGMLSDTDFVLTDTHTISGALVNSTGDLSFVLGGVPTGTDVTVLQTSTLHVGSDTFAVSAAIHFAHRWLRVDRHRSELVCGGHRDAAPAGAGDQQRPGILRRNDGDALGAGEQRGRAPTSATPVTATDADATTR